MADYTGPIDPWCRERGDLIRRARKDLGKDQEWLAEKLGVSRNQVSHIESGKTRELRMEYVKALMRNLGLLPSQLTRDPKVLGELAQDAGAVREPTPHFVPVSADEEARIFAAEVFKIKDEDIRNALKTLVDAVVTKQVKAEREVAKALKTSPKKGKPSSSSGPRPN